MMDSPTPAAAKSLVSFAIALALVATVGRARAQQAAEKSDTATSTTPAASSPDAATATAPAASAAPEPALADPPTAPAPVPVPTPAAAAVAPASPSVETGAVAGPVGGGDSEVWARSPLTLTVGKGDKQWSFTFYGIIEANYIMDTTRSYDERIGSTLVARSDTYEGNHGRTQFSIRNTRIGLKFGSPTVAGVKPSALVEADFYGASTPSDTPEKTYYDAATFRIRHAYLLLENPYVDLLAGQTYDVFGWQNTRSAQLRLSHEFGDATSPVTLDVAAAAVRPAQRDSQVPDANASLRLNVNSWKGMITTNANAGSAAEPLFLKVSGAARQFKANAFAPPPTQTSNSASGWGVSVDVLVPVVPAHDDIDRGNCLTLTSSFVHGTGIADLINSTGGASFPTLSNPAQASPPPEYDANIDQGLVSFDTQGVLHTIDWQAIKLGLQYYLPPSGRLFVTVNYTQAHSANMAKLFPKGGAEIELLGRVANTTRHGEATLYWDVTPAVRFGLSGAYTEVEYLDGNKPHNWRGMGIAQYAF